MNEEARFGHRGLRFGRAGGGEDEIRSVTFASHRLKHTTDSIDAVGASVGFASRAAFQRAFRRTTGQSPSEYRAAVAAPNGARE